MNEFLIAVFALLQLADGITTREALRRGGSESNPLVKHAMDKFGVAEALIAFKLGAVAGFVLVLNLLPELAYALVAFYAWVAYNNYRVINNLKERQ